jgi:hypothetical protein
MHRKMREAGRTRALNVAVVLCMFPVVGCGARDSLSFAPGASIADAGEDRITGGGNAFRDSRPDSSGSSAHSSDDGATDARQEEVDVVDVRSIYFQYWTKWIEEQTPPPGTFQCGSCLFSEDCGLPSEGDCAVGTDCVFEHCRVSTNGDRLWACVES